MAGISLDLVSTHWLTHSLDGRIEGLKNTPVPDQPLMGMAFYGFRMMYVVAIAMFSVAVASLWLRCLPPSAPICI
jgi:cytochrome d ubiquinol oxidase subunit I